jgi:hypothetical protein
MNRCARNLGLAVLGSDGYMMGSLEIVWKEGECLLNDGCCMEIFDGIVRAIFILSFIIRLERFQLYWTFVIIIFIFLLLFRNGRII